MNQQLVKILGEHDTSLNLVSALLMYQSGSGDVYVTTHPIDVDANQPHRAVIGAGVPMSKASLAGFAEAINVATAYSGFVPENLLFTAPNMMVWWTPATIRTTWFRAPEDDGITAHGPTAHPAMVFVAVPNDWFVFALPDDKRPGPKSRLCHSPHFNVWDGGRICTGNVKLPPAPTAEAIAEYERAFFQSRFTHPNRKGAVKYKGGIKALWRDQLAGPDPDAMRRALVPAGETLQAAIERISDSQLKQR